GAKPVVKTLFKTAIRIGKVRNIKYARNGQKAPYLIEKQYQYFGYKVLRKPDIKYRPDDKRIKWATYHTYVQFTR
ncbi:MAG: hypothetical protein IKO39_10575, partial [Treponema sp.]|nr:hypothetical protein [Treponema sp.]